MYLSLYTFFSHNIVIALYLPAPPAFGSLTHKVLQFGILIIINQVCFPKSSVKHFPERFIFRAFPSVFPSVPRGPRVFWFFNFWFRTEYDVIGLAYQFRLSLQPLSLLIRLLSFSPLFLMFSPAIFFAAPNLLSSCGFIHILH